MPFYHMTNPSISRLKEKFFKLGTYRVDNGWFELKEMHLSREPAEELVKVKEDLDKYLKKRQPMF